MSFRSLFAALFLGSFLTSVLPGQNADPFADPAEVGGDEVKVSLLAAQSAVVPGQKFTVALKFEHKEHWHSFWRNSGEFAQPIRITWELPAGFTADDTLWPIPKAKPTDPALGTVQHIYEGTVHLVTDIAAPASLQAGDKVSLTARLKFQVCKEQCVQKEFDLPLELTVADKAEPVPAVAADVAAVRKAQPAPNAAWKTSVTSQGDKWLIRAEPGAGAAADPGAIYFFDAAAAIENTVQEWKQDGAVRVLTMNGQATKPPGQQPWGYLHAEKSWVDGQQVFEIPVGTAPVAVSQAPAVPPVPVQPAAGTADDDALIAQIRSWGVRPLGGGEQDTGPTGFVAILFALLGGMILNLMPCVFPVLGIKILSFVKQSGEDHAAVKKHGLVYAVGVIISVMLLAAVLLALRKSSESVGWGFQLQNPWFLIALITLVFGFSLSMTGMFEVGAKLTGVGGELQDQGGYRGSFFSGLLTVVLATPCTGPFMGPALGFALSKETPYWLVWAIFLALGVGLALPYVILSWFPALVKKLPRPGAWMETFKQFMAFPMFATAVWLVTVFAGSTGESGVAYILFALTLFAMVLWLYGRFFQRPAKPRSKSIAAVTAVLCLAGAGWLAAQAAQQKAPASSHEIALSPQLIIERREKGLVTVVDLWAKWCLQCELNRKAAFDREEFRQALPGYDAIFMLGDNTVEGSQAGLLVEKFTTAYKSGGIPYAFIVPPSGPVIELPRVIASPSTLIEGLKEARQQAGK